MKKKHLLTILCFTAASALTRAQGPPQTAELPGDVSLEYVANARQGGTPVLFLHGFTDSWKSFRTLFPLIKDSIPFYALSLRGHGNSFKPASGYDVSQMAQDVAAFMDNWNLPPVVLVGHSMGAAVVLELALQYPARVKGLVLTGAFSGFTRRVDLRAFYQELVQLPDSIPYAFAHAFQKSTLHRSIPQAQLDIYVQESLRLPAFAWKQVLGSLLRKDYEPHLYRIQQPTLLVWGDKDTLATREDQARLQQGIKGSMLKVHTGTGHAVHWEDPAGFATDLFAFLKFLSR